MRIVGFLLRLSVFSAAAASCDAVNTSADPIEIPVYSEHYTLFVDMAVDDTVSTFILDTGAQLFIANPVLSDRLTKNPRYPQLSPYYLWGRRFDSWILEDTPIHVPGTDIAGTIPYHRARLSAVAINSDPECDALSGCGGLLGAGAVAAFAKRIEHQRRGHLLVHPGRCFRLLNLRSPMPMVTATDAEGRPLNLLIDSGMEHTRIFSDAGGALLNVPGLPEPLAALGPLRGEVIQDATLNGVHFDGAIGWDHLQRTRWSWVPCTGAFQFSGTIP